MEHFHLLIKELLKDNEPAVLATIVNVQGSAYRKEGASMLFKQDNFRLGVISGGCLENDLHHRAECLFNTGRTEIHEYDLSAEDDLGWGVGAGCNGIITVLIRDIDKNSRQVFTLLNQYLSEKLPVLFIQSMNNLNHCLFVSRLGKTFGHFYEDFPTELKSFPSTVPFYNDTQLKTVGKDTYFIQLLWPVPSLYIIGAGVDARPLAHLAGKLDYVVHLLDWREAVYSEADYPYAASFQIGDVVKLVHNMTFSPLDSVVIMTHDFQRDSELLLAFKNITLFYFGILGSKKRTERLLGGEIPDSLHSPVGLSIGADGPWEIAVSIVAELIEQRRRSST